MNTLKKLLAYFRRRKPRVCGIQYGRVFNFRILAIEGREMLLLLDQTPRPERFWLRSVN